VYTKIKKLNKEKKKRKLKINMKLLFIKYLFEVYWELVKFKNLK